MACYRHLVYTVMVISVIWLSSTTAEIHRAKTSNHKNGVKQRRPTDVAAELEDSEDMRIIQDVETNAYEVWTYSLLGSILVGLSGIFPLLVGTATPVSGAAVAIFRSRDKLGSLTPVLCYAVLRLFL